MFTAVGRLLPIDSPLIVFSTTRNLAPCSEVDHHAGAREVALMFGARSACSTSQDTPRRLLTAVVVQATLGAYVYHALLSMCLAEYRCFAARNIEPRFNRAGVMRAPPIEDVYHAVGGMFLA